MKRNKIIKVDCLWIAFFTCLIAIIIILTTLIISSITTPKLKLEKVELKVEKIGNVGNVKKIVEVKEVKKCKHKLDFNNDKYVEYNCCENIKDTFTEQELIELQQIALAEAEVQGIGGMAFVMQVVINRVNDDRFPDTIHDVINQHGQFSTVDIYQSKTPTDNSYKALELLNILNNQGALYFEMNSGSSWQSNNLTYLFSYDNHNFYM